MRREAAKRKLERRQERQVEQNKRRQRVAAITSVGVVVLVVVGIVLVTTLGSDPAPDPAAAPETTEPAAPGTEPAALGECTFTPGEPAVKPAPVPTMTTASTEGTVAVTLRTDRGDIPITLDRAMAPCTVESFLSLTTAGYYDASPCHRLTTSESLRVLQCGDPTGSGTGGPGYTVNDEKPTALGPDAATGTSAYTRGLLAMANTGQPNSGGSQFFLVYGDSGLPPDYTVFGSIGESGLAVLDQIAAAGTADGTQDGAPAQPVTITQAVPA